MKIEKDKMRKERKKKGIEREKKNKDKKKGKEREKKNSRIER